MDIKVLEELKKEIPPLTPEEINLLRESIKAEGIRDPLVIWKKDDENILVDGHNRYTLAKELDCVFDTTFRSFDTITDARIWIRNNQMGRRNLTDGWKAELALRNKDDLLEIGRKRISETQKVRHEIESLSLSETDKDRKEDIIHEPDTTFEEINEPEKAIPETKKIEQHNTRREVANELGWSTGKVAQAEYVKKNKPDIWEKAKSGDYTINKAYQTAKKEIRKSELQEERKRIAERSEVVKKNDLWNIEQGNIKTWETEKKYDFIITDPPYPKEFLMLYETLAIRAKKWLKPGGLLVAMCGQSYLEIIYEMLSEHLDYYWTACYLTPGQPTPLRQVNVNTTWKPLLIFKRKGEKYTGKIFGDVFKSNGNDKDYHKWGQSVSGMYDIISKICLPGQSILDPFCGAGTTGVAAIKHKCFFDGVELLQENVNISRGRLNDQTTE